MRLESSESFCLEAFKNFPQMGRFTLRDEGKTIAIGKVLKCRGIGPVPYPAVRLM
ncbi:hypothetical protein X798_07477 [Onchocerca flexuosa]|uniref:GTP-eEF1A C-terminal domain-containing protein n=1 Tax=Onchocerca flexuosa TaxID=387005 RepID=A0A238BJC1_9BILA|nr:hypothetical protein X798_07477 [Onchocerca flexuosa]